MSSSSSVAQRPAKPGLCCRALLLALAVPVAMAWLSGRLAADETFVCEGGRVVHVQSGQLERMKRADPCIAAHYGMKVTAAAPALQGAVAAQGLAPSDAPLPVRNPRPMPVALAPIAEAAPGRTAATASASLSAHTPALASADIVTAPRVERVVFQHQAATASVVPQPAAANATVDYRRVPVINAAPGTNAVYLHTR